MLTAKSMGAVATVAKAFVALHQAKLVEVVRIKDRFATPSAGGWRDLMINFVMVGDANRHVCEVQVAHEMMLTARKGLPGHAIYAIVRNASELIESSGKEHELRVVMVRAMREGGGTDAAGALLLRGELKEAAASLGDRPLAEQASLVRAYGNALVACVVGRLVASSSTRCGMAFSAAMAAWLAGCARARLVIALTAFSRLSR